MTSQLLFYVIIAIIIINYLIDKLLDYLNAQHFNDAVPPLLEDVYNKEEYQKSQEYKKENYKFSTLVSTFSIIITLAFFLFDGFAFVDKIARNLSNNEIIISLIFFGIIMIGSDLLTLPFSYYQNFVIEKKYGFNKSTKKLFFIDKVKGWLLMIVLGGVILTTIMWFYQLTGKNFWIYAWALVAVFSIFMTMFYSTLVVPLFNKQTLLEDGELKTELEKFAKKVGFSLDKIFVIDGSKRSTKANAYFTGFGKRKESYYMIH